jgi:hypothetical protein
LPRGSIGPERFKLVGPFDLWDIHLLYPSLDRLSLSTAALQAGLIAASIALDGKR